MSDESPAQRETRELLDLEADQGLNPEQSERLAGLLSTQPEALDLFIEYTDQSAALHKTSGQNLSIGEELVSRVENGLMDHPRTHWIPPLGKTWLAAASIALVAGLVFFNIGRLSPPEATINYTNAKLARAVNADWKIGTGQDTSSIKLRSGESLPEGRIHLVTGLAQVTFDSGTAMILEAPAEFEIRGDNAGFLYQGRATARVPQGAQGFILDTPALHVVDLGTEFALSASASGLTDVMVIEGEVEVNLPTSLDTQPIRLLENHAMRADRTIGTLESIESENLPSFRRTLPSEVALRPDATGNDWNSAANWDDNLPASADKDYHIGRGFSQAIDTPTQKVSTFKGRSLHINRGGILRLHDNRKADTIHIDNLHLDRGTLKHIPSGRSLQITGEITFDGNATIDLVDNSGRTLIIDSAIRSSEEVESRILIRQGQKRRRFSTQRESENTFADSILRLKHANPGFKGEWYVQGGILEPAVPGALGHAHLIVSSNGKLNLGGRNHTLRSVKIAGELLEHGLHTFKALQARFPGHILGSGGTLTIEVQKQ